ncbi:unnamed protein product [Protopolystoma xenopodis]|uniref:Uncharacterized protein n=1 Tax=Protopolystoma xenopodis TaxID=117903 RepID=A0A448WA07_9PLAT|nr:unnamed protein product [Protopolystoma xenopodis]
MSRPTDSAGSREDRPPAGRRRAAGGLLAATDGGGGGGSNSPGRAVAWLPGVGGPGSGARVGAASGAGTHIDPVRSGNSQVKVINAFLQVGDHAGLDRYLSKQQVPTLTLNMALQRACIASDEEAVRVLARRGADVNYTDQFGTTILHFAMRGGGDSDMIQELLRLGLDHQSWRQEGQMLVHWACRKGHLQVVR